MIWILSLRKKDTIYIKLTINFPQNFQLSRNWRVTMKFYKLIIGSPVSAILTLPVPFAPLSSFHASKWGAEHLEPSFLQMSAYTICYYRNISLTLPRIFSLIGFFFRRTTSVGVDCKESKLEWYSTRASTSVVFSLKQSLLHFTIGTKLSHVVEYDWRPCLL